MNHRRFFFEGGLTLAVTSTISLTPDPGSPAFIPAEWDRPCHLRQRQGNSSLPGDTSKGHPPGPLRRLQAGTLADPNYHGGQRYHILGGPTIHMHNQGQQDTILLAWHGRQGSGKAIHGPCQHRIKNQRTIRLHLRQQGVPAGTPLWVAGSIQWRHRALPELCAGKHEWGPEKCPHHVVTSLQQQHGFVISSLLVLEDFNESVTVNEEELDPPCVSCAKGGGDSMDPNLIQCERCMQWIHSYCLPTPLATSEILLVKGWTCPQCAPPYMDDPCPNQMCLVQFAPSHQSVKHIQKTPGGDAAMRAFRRHERRLPQPPQASHFQLDSSPTHPPTPPASQKSPRPPSHRTKSLGRPTGRNGKRGRGAPDPSSPQPPSSPRLPPPPQRTPQQDLNLRRQRELIIRGGSRRATPSQKKKKKLGPPPPPPRMPTSFAPLNSRATYLLHRTPARPAPPATSWVAPKRGKASH